MHGLEAEYWGQIDFLYFDRELALNRRIVDFYGITYQPVFVLLSADGNEVARWFTPNEDTIRGYIEEILVGR